MAGSSTSSVPSSNKESLEDCMCTICLCILIHPVTLPCGHELCMPCFKKSVEEASLTCPLCRTRISTWARKASRTNTLVNQKRWEQIQKLFPQRVQRRLDGIDDDTDEEIQEKEEIHASYRQMVQLSEPGEIRKEYEEELKRLEAQQAVERQKEEEASALLIQKLCSVEEQTLQEARRQQEEMASRDSQLAQELGRLINTTESETPVNRLLQESKHNYPNSPVPPSMPSVLSASLQDSSQRGKQPLIKNSNNKTLETFFRRLPASGGKRTARCSSEPVTLVTGEKDAGVGVSPRCPSAPIRGKENLPMVPPRSPPQNAADVVITSDTSFYQRLELGHTFTTGGGQRSESLEIGDGVQAGQAGVADIAVDGREMVVIVDVHDRGRERAESVTTVHSDGSESVIMCEDQEEGGGGPQRQRQDPRFRPIESNPHTPPQAQAQASAVTVEPCVVRITPRILFSTDRVSSTIFPIVPSPAVSNITALVSDRTDGHAGSSKSHRQKTAGEDVSKKAETGTGNNPGCVKSRLRADRCGAVESPSQAVRGVHHSDHNQHSRRRARSTSPPSRPKPRPRRLLVPYEKLGKRGYCRPTLLEFKLREKLQSAIEEVVSDSELDSPSPRYKLRYRPSAAPRLMRGAGDGRRLEEEWKPGQSDKAAMEESSDGESEGQLVLSVVPTTSQAVVPLGRETRVMPSSSHGLQAPSSLSACRTGGREAAAAACPQDADGITSASEACSSSENRSTLTVSNHHVSSSPRPAVRTVSSDVRSEDVYSDVTSGKGKRLLKKSKDSSLSVRNCPKSSGKVAEQSRSEGEEKSHSLNAGSGEKAKTVKTSAVSQHTVPQAELSSTGSERQGHVPSTTVATHDDSDKLVRRVKRSVRQRTKVSAASDGKASETAEDAERTDIEKEQKKPSRVLRAGQKAECSRNQRSIRDWFSSSQAAPRDQTWRKPASNGRKPQPPSGAKMSESPDVESDMSTAPSSAASSSPDKLSVRMSQRARKLNPKLDDFLLTVTKKLKQFKADSYTDSDSTPASSPSKAHTTPTTSPTKSVKRKLWGSSSAVASSPASKRGKLNSGPSCKPSLTSLSSNITDRSGQGRQKQQQQKQQQQEEDGQTSSAPSCDPTPHKLDSCSLPASYQILASEEEGGGEEVSQEERDHRIALQLQQQFDLADKFHLQVVRFKGTDDQYTLRRKRSHTRHDQ